MKYLFLMDMYVYFAFIHVYLLHACLVPVEMNEVSDSLIVELQRFMSFHVCAGNWTWVQETIGLPFYHENTMAM